MSPTTTVNDITLPPSLHNTGYDFSNRGCSMLMQLDQSDVVAATIKRGLELLQLSHQFTHLHVCVVYIRHGSVCIQKKNNHLHF